MAWGDFLDNLGNVFKPKSIGISSAAALSLFGDADAIKKIIEKGFNSLKSSVQEIDNVVKNGYIGGGMKTIDPTMQGHTTRTAIEPNTPFREHLEPSGHIDAGLCSKQDLMFTPYELDEVNYKILNMFTKHNTDGSEYTNGSGIISAKAVGHEWGVSPCIQFGFSDGLSTAVPMIMYQFDMNDNEWRRGIQGAWRAGRNVEANKFVLYSGKLFKVASTGVTGDIPPTHSNGVLSDGNINLEFIKDFKLNSNFGTTVVFGDRDDLPKFGFPNVRLQLLKDMLVDYERKIYFLDQNSKKMTIQAAANNTIRILDDEGNILLIIEKDRIDFKSTILARNGFMDKTGAIGKSGSFTSHDGKNITVSDGIIVGIS